MRPGLPLRIVAALALVALGFLLTRSAAVEAGFAGIALAIAASTEALLSIIGSAVSRDGIVLRDLESGAAVAVTPACDGHGLLVMLAASMPLVIRRAPSVLAALGFALAAFLAIEIFNLIRVALLYLIGPDAPAPFEAAHYIAFPLASALLVAALALATLPAETRGPALARLGQFCLIAVPLSALWLWLGVEIAPAVLVAPADLWLGLLGPSAISELATGAEGTLIRTHLSPAGQEALLSLPIQPEHFLLPLPLVLAGAAFLWRTPLAASGLLLAALALMALALALASVTAVETAAAEAGPLLSRAPGLYAAAAHQPMADWMLALNKVAQNLVVHFNLFLLPFLGPMLATAANRGAFRRGLAGTA